MSYLLNRAFELELKKELLPKPILWNKDILTNKLNGLEKIEFQSYLNDKNATKKSFEAVIRSGAVLIENVGDFKNGNIIIILFSTLKLTTFEGSG